MLTGTVFVAKWLIIESILATTSPSLLNVWPTMTSGWADKPWRLETG